jgi:hypothetical protein
MKKISSAAAQGIGKIAITAVGSTEPNHFRYPVRRPSPVKQESGGPVLLRRITPLPRRDVA